MKVTDLFCPACGYQWTDPEMTSNRLFFAYCPLCDANMVQPASDAFDDDGHLRPEYHQGESEAGDE